MGLETSAIVSPSIGAAVDIRDATTPKTLVGVNRYRG